MQLTIKQRYDNLRMNTIARQGAPTQKRPSSQLRLEPVLVELADRKLALSGDIEQHSLLIRRARRQHTAVHEAVIRGDLDGVRKHLTGENVDLATVNGLTPLHLAVFAFGQVQRSVRWDRLVRTGEKCIEEQIVNYLVEAGAPVDALDDMKRLPAALVDGGRVPTMVAEAMVAKREQTERLAPGTADTNEKPTTYSAFYDEADGNRAGHRGGPGNKSGKGGNQFGITKIKGEYRFRDDLNEEF